MVRVHAGEPDFTLGYSDLPRRVGVPAAILIVWQFLCCPITKAGEPRSGKLDIGQHRRSQYLSMSVLSQSVLRLPGALYSRQRLRAQSSAVYALCHADRDGTKRLIPH